MSTTPPKQGLTRRPSHALPIQLFDLFVMELSNWRWSWRVMLFSGTITPLFSIVALGIFARDSGGDALVYVLTGNIVVALLFGTMNSVHSRVEWLRFQGGLDYFATLPIPRYALVLAMVLAFLMMSLPSVVVTLVLGSILLDVPIKLNPLILLVIPLCAAALAGVGAMMAFIGRDRGESGNLLFVLTLLLTALGAVVIPPDRLPGAAIALGRLSPATYAASALRQTVVGPVTAQIILDLAVLLAMTVLFLWLVGRKMEWRQ